MDSLTKEHRSWNMSRIRSTNTKPEMLVRSFLHRNGFRFRLHVKELPGHPDIVLPKYKTVVEIRGCFWHRHKGCKKATMPSTNADFWGKKFQCNIERDHKNELEMHHLGWHVIVVWECETAKDIFPPKALVGFVENNRRDTSMYSESKNIETGAKGYLIKDQKKHYTNSQKKSIKREEQNG